MSGRDVLKAGVMGGLLGGVVSGVPYVSSLNVCCCALVVLAGVFAGWVLQSDARGLASNGAAAGAGLLAGGLAGLVSVPMQALLNPLVIGRAQLEKELAAAMTSLRGLGFPPESLAAAEQAQRAMLGLDLNAWTVLGALGAAAVYSFFGMLGGLLGHALFRARPGRGALPPVLPPTLPPPVPPRESSGAAPDDDEPVEGGEIPQGELPALPPASPDGEPRREDEEPRTS